MAKTDRLFSLIKSLSKSEKRYFSIYVGTGQQHKKYLQLFKVMEAQTDYDEQRIRVKFRDDPMVTQLHVAKNYLKQLVLKSLRSFYAEDSSDMKLHNALQDIEILFKRDLFDQCLARIGQAEKLAQRYQNQTIQLELLNWKRRLHLLRLGSYSAQGEIQKIIDWEKQLLQQLGHISKYWDLTINLRVRFGDTDFAKILQHDYLKSGEHATSFRSKILYYHLLYSSQTVTGDRTASEQALNDLIEYLKSQIDLIKEDPGPYVTALNNKIGLLLNQRRYQEIIPILNEIRDIPRQYKLKQRDSTTMKLWLRSYNVELELYRDAHQIEKGIALIPTVKDFMKRHEKDIPREYHVLFRYQFAYLFFIAGDHRSSLQDINKILAQRNSGVRDDIVSYAHFLNLIIHLELGNTTVLRYAVDATRRFIKKRGKVEDFEKELLRFFSRISTQPVLNHRNLFLQLQNKLFGPTPLLDLQQLDYLDFEHWLNQKTGNTVRRELTSFNSD